MTTELKPGSRYAPLDMFKTILAWGMILGHVILLTSEQLGPFADATWNYINLTSFSGFLFAFGFGVGMGRGSARPRPWRQRLLPALTMLASTYLVGFCFETLVGKQPVTADFLFDLLSLRVLFGYSEFLASFFVLYLAIAVARPLLQRLQNSIRAMFCIAIVCMSSTFLVTDAQWPLLGTLIGNTGYGTFPLIPYFPLFMLGLYYAGQGRGPDLIEAAAALAATAACLISINNLGAWPGRFPPTKVWITGSAAFLLAYWVASLQLADRVAWQKLVFACGRHVLACLVFSTLVLFVVHNQFGTPVSNYWLLAIASLGLIGTTTAYCLLVETVQVRLRRARAQRAGA